VNHLFEVKYFDRVAYLAQKSAVLQEHGVAGFERVFETVTFIAPEPQPTAATD